MQTKVTIVAGARPNFMKVAPLWNVLAQDTDFSVSLVHTGQHFDDAMSGQFFRELGLPQPEFHLGVGGGSHAQQTAEIMKRLEPVLIECKPVAVIVVGDVNSTLAAALTAKKLGIAVVHGEAGLRSFDRTMPEEINRVVTDAISDILLVTEESGRMNLLHEGLPPERIHMVGNLMIDSLMRYLPRAQQSGATARWGVDQQRFGLITLHRPSNVDNERQFAGILDALNVISEDLLLLWPVHPRARALFERGVHRLSNRIKLLEPLGYLECLALQAASAAVFTDSGGIQEETTVLRVPCLTLRDNTERPSTIEYGTNRLAGTCRESILRTWKETIEEPKAGNIPPLWDGRASFRCHAVLRTHLLGEQNATGYLYA
jgi:UDP-N-acetylglucosamine 2-epimerase (non-hydrolysing)